MYLHMHTSILTLVRCGDVDRCQAVDLTYFPFHEYKNALFAPYAWKTHRYSTWEYFIIQVQQSTTTAWHIYKKGRRWQPCRDRTSTREKNGCLAAWLLAITHRNTHCNTHWRSHCHHCMQQQSFRGRLPRFQEKRERELFAARHSAGSTTHTQHTATHTQHTATHTQHTATHNTRRYRWGPRASPSLH